MIALLAKIFIKDRENQSPEAIRSKYGVLCGGFGIFLNVILFCLKLFAGTITGSVAVTADAFNNISDAGSSAVTMIGFRLAGKKPDPEHPFGHGRIEYITGLIVAMLIFFMAFELISSSITAVMNPEKTEFSILSAIILAFSVVIKLYMFFYNRSVGNKIGSAAMRATALDSLADCAATGAVLASLIFTHYTNILIDGYVGLAVAGFILFSGYRAAKETIEPLLGVRPEKELIDELEALVLSNPPITGVHDFILHDYGPGRRFLSLHAEVPMDEDILFIHDVVDNVEIDIFEKYGIETVIHMDPIDTKNEAINYIKSRVSQLLGDMDHRFKAHDFRMVVGPTHTNVLFDIAIPADSKIDPDVVRLTVSAALSAENPHYRCVIRIDIDYA